MNTANVSDWSIPEFRVERWAGRSSDACIVIPVIDEGARIGRLLRCISALDIPAQADVLIVDGGSTDGSLEEPLLSETQVAGLLTKTGPGRLGAQLRCAYAFALEQGYEFLVTIDGNDKDDPDAIPAFLDALRSGYAFVQGSRFIEGGIGENTPKLREIAIRWLHAPALSLASGFHWTDTTQGFRGYRRELLLDGRVAPFRSVFSRYELLAYLSSRAPRLGYRCVELPTVRRYPRSGATPTKIAGWRGNLELVTVLFKACFRRYDP